MEFNLPAIRKDIQILRGLSVLLVFIFHLEFTNFFGAGFIGVDVYDLLLKRLLKFAILLLLLID
jgi:hypothetical protein